MKKRKTIITDSFDSPRPVTHYARGYRVHYHYLSPLLFIPAVFLFSLCSYSFLAGRTPLLEKEDTSEIIESLELPKQYSSGLEGELVLEASRATRVKDEDRLLELSDWQVINSKVGTLVRVENTGLGLSIDEPVLCGVADNRQWLRTNIRGEYDVGGTVFMDYQCNLNWGLLKLIHGHNMKNGTMFSGLPILLGISDCSEAPLIELTFEDGVAQYEVFAVVSVNSKEEALPINVYATVEETEGVLEDLLNRSLVPGGVIHSVDSVVLNTCWYGESGQEHNLHCIVAASKI